MHGFSSSLCCSGFRNGLSSSPVLKVSFKGPSLSGCGDGKTHRVPELLISLRERKRKRREDFALVFISVSILLLTLLLEQSSM